jgi:hypothetical protein
MKIITVATHSDYYYPTLVNACRQLGLTLIVLGWGEKWKGYYWKFRLMKNYISTLDDMEIVVFVDAFDVIPLYPEHVITEKFLQFKKPIVISTELPPSNLLLYLGYRDIFTPYRNKYVNSGCYIGYVKYLKQMFRIMEFLHPKFHLTDDQVILNKSLEHPFFKKNVALDAKNVLFLTLRTDENLLYQGKMNGNNKYYRFHNGTVKWKLGDPAFVHGPGNIDMKHIIYAYQLSPPERIPKGSVFSRTENYLQNTRTIKYLVPIVLIIIVIYLIHITIGNVHLKI